MKVLVTGAAGKIGRALRKGLAGRYDLLRLADVAPQAPAQTGEECVTADIRDLTSMEVAASGIDCVVHLAGIPEEPPEHAWEQVLPVNVVGTYNVFEAARRSGARRIVFASSNHVVGFYRREQTVDVDVPLRPHSYYGVSKAFGEAMGRLYADKHGMSVACLRIGSFREKPEDRRQLATWISHRDTVQLFRRAIEAPEYHFLVAYGVSNNAESFWKNDAVDWLGYRPEDAAEEHAGRVAGSAPEDRVSRQFHGGSYCAMNFSGNPESID